ncbi:hypothetical protein [Parahaliea aestuarii]|uniref:Cupin domain-containing protein n=1 Tax=Parahaliea aestuarii TaxID=1852021 RepID=A0A5C8ZRL3_9GAMM|nr:hypothetical protein [Parahaliea aestuarii]TXS91128.1 hypothetical protein FVW59_13060 [Parahaliea aestuarii]
MRHTITPSPVLHYCQGEPQQALAGWQPERLPALLLVDFELPQYWLQGSPPVALTALYLKDGEGLRVSVTDATLAATDGLSVRDQFSLWLERHQLPAFDPTQALTLSPRHIPKPWGQEIWFTGVEERGVCAFAAEGSELPIPWLQAAMPANAAGEPGRGLVLLKILDPLPEPVRGDLYFELHEQKREVYVVTHIDRQAWPDGVGAIRYGFDPAVRAGFPSDEDFRGAYLEAVADYEGVRRQIDALPPELSPSAEVLAQEARLRAAMDRFTFLRPLQVGDVIKVPLRLPHSLQHGVRTVEFQTPVYERKILSFAQRVLTQDHWDTREAAEVMQLAPPAQEPFELLQQAAQLQVERIVDFEDFEVQRATLEAGASMSLEAADSYLLAMVVSGALHLGERVFGPGEALLLPQRDAIYQAGAGAAEPLVMLLARPR